MKEKQVVFLDSREVCLGVDKATGFICSLVFKKQKIDLFQQLRQNIPGYVGQVRVFDELQQKWYNGLYDAPIIRNFIQNKKSIQYQLTFRKATFVLEVRLSFEKDFLKWCIKGRKTNSKITDRSLRILFDMPIIAGWNIWAPCDDGSFAFDGMTSFEFNHIQVPYVSPRDIILPMVSHYSHELDIGYSFVSPMGNRVPALRFQCLNADKNFNWGAMQKPIATIPTLEAQFFYIGLVQSREMQAEVQVCFHEGDWRPAVGKMFEKWKEYFLPISDVIYKYQGVFINNLPDGAKKAKLFRKFNATTYEVHGHFEHYGDYYQEGKENWLRLNIREGLSRNYFKEKSLEEIEEFFATHSDEEIYDLYKEYIEKQEDWYEKNHPRGKSSIRNFRMDIQNYMNTLKRNKIGAYWYFNYTDGYKPFVEANFHDSIARNEDGSYQPSGWFYCHNMNSDPKYSFGQHMLQSAKKIINRYKGIAGFFLDCFRHFEIDFAHDDGVTVVNHKAVYSMNFSYDAIEKELKTKIFDLKKHASFANKPQSIRSMRYVDAVLLEGDGPIAEAKYFWACIAKPLFFLWTSNKESLDFNLRRAIYSGCFPRLDLSASYGSFQKIQNIYQQFLPLYEAFRKRIFCFEPDPMRVPKGSIGQLFTVDKHYVASIINENISSDDTVRWAKTPYSVFRLQRGADVGRVSIRYPNSTKWKDVLFRFDGTFIYVPMVDYLNCAVVKLFVTKNTKRRITNNKFKEGVDYCGDPNSSFEDISKR